MMHPKTATILLAALAAGLPPLTSASGPGAPLSAGQATAPADFSEESRKCIECHKDESPGLYLMWGGSRHYRGKVGCYECHGAERGDPDAYLHYGVRIATIVSPADCARCHSKEAEEFRRSRHSKAAHIEGSPESLLAEVVEGSRRMRTEGFPEGVPATVVNGCWKCHGSRVVVLPDIMLLDPATWPNAGIGRVNPDGTEGSCSACHGKHSFSVAQARHPDTCGRCHQGPDHPQREIYEESRHGAAFAANLDRMNLDSAKWIVGEDYGEAPTCATCHVSATPNQPVTHDIGQRISWNHRGVLSERPEVADARLGLPGMDEPAEARREAMKDVCLSCHSRIWVEGFYAQYDSVVELYHEKYARPGERLYELARPLLRPVDFGNHLDLVWFELWHNEGRRTRHAAAMMGPDMLHWHGTYDLAVSFYDRLVPELERLVREGLESQDPGRVEAARALRAGLDQVLEGDDHRWSLGRVDPEEAARRAEAAEEFRRRHQ